jgi:hypothetical protein
MARKRSDSEERVVSTPSGSNANDGLSFKGGYPEKYLINRWKIPEITARPEWQVVMGEPDLPSALLYSRPNIYLYPLVGPHFVADYLASDDLKILPFTGATASISPLDKDSLVVSEFIDKDIADGIFIRTVEANRFRLTWDTSHLKYYMSVLCYIVMAYHSINNTMVAVETRIPGFRDLDDAFAIDGGFGNQHRAVTDVVHATTGVTSRETTVALLAEIRLMMQDFVLPSGMQNELSHLLSWHRAGTFDDDPIIGYYVSNGSRHEIANAYSGWSRTASKDEVPFVVDLYNLVVQVKNNKTMQRIAANVKVWTGDAHQISLPEGADAIGSHSDDFLDQWSNSGFYGTLPVETSESDETIDTGIRATQNVKSFDFTNTYLVTFGSLSDDTLLRLVVGQSDELRTCLNYYLSNLTLDRTRGTLTDSAAATKWYNDLDTLAAGNVGRGRVYTISDSSSVDSPSISWLPLEDSFNADVAILNFPEIMHHSERAKLGYKSVVAAKESGRWRDGIQPLSRLAGEPEYVDARLLRMSLLRKWRALAGLPT